MATSLPDVDAILEMKLRDLMKLCKELKIDCKGFRTAAQFQEAVFDYMKQHATLHRAPPPFVTAAGALFEAFAKKRLEVVTILDDVSKFLQAADVKPWLTKLDMQQYDSWMTPEMFEKAKESIMKGTPTLLVAGPTSAGKSTLLNALLGEQVLPTSYNATTSALCEIKYSEEPGKKYAVVHVNMENSDPVPIKLDLSLKEHQDKFAEYVYANREQLAEDDSGEGEAVPQCTRAEIFWPEDFLKHFTLVDSPGVTEQEGDSVARQITEKFQTDLACGFIYVVDGTRAAEEAAQVGGLLLAVSKGVGSLPPANSALFVINKWDLASQQMRKDEERQEFMSKLEQQVSTRWSGLKPHQQLITMNAKLAVRAQQLGSSTGDMKKLCKAIQQLLPKGMDHMILQGLRGVQALLDRVEQSTESTLRVLELPMQERVKKWEVDWKKLESFRHEDGTFGKEVRKLKDSVDWKIRQLAFTLWNDLKSGKGKDTVFLFKGGQMKEWERKVFEAREVQSLVEGRVTSAVLQHDGFEKFIEWATKEIKGSTESVLAHLEVFGAEVTNFTPSTIDTGWADRLVDDKKRWKPKNVAKAVALGSLAVAAAPVALVLGLIAIPIFKAAQAVGDITFKKTYMRTYDDFLAKCAENDYKMLQEIVTDLLERSCEAVRLLNYEIPRRIKELESELETRAKQEEKFKGDYKNMLELCLAKKKKLAKFVLSLNIHEYAENDIEWSNPRTAVAVGSFGKVFKVNIPEKGIAAVKLMTDAVNEENAEEYLKELNSCRQFRHPNVVAFYGSVQVASDPEEPPQLGLVFEWCGGGTLLEEITSKKIPSPCKPEGVQRGLEVVLQMASGLKFLHSRKVVHRDLKPENVMMTDKRVVKLGDMGLAKPVERVTGTFCGTILYMAPEVLSSKPYGPSADMFSIGIIMWEIWNKKRAYTDFFTMNLGIHDFIQLVTDNGVRPGNFERPSPPAPGGVDMKALHDQYVLWAETCWNVVAAERLTAEQLHDKVKNFLEN